MIHEHPQHTAQHERTGETDRQPDRELHEAALEDQPRHLPRCAPTAMRTPISWVRCVTEYAITA